MNIRIVACIFLVGFFSLEQDIFATTGDGLDSLFQSLDVFLGDTVTVTDTITAHTTVTPAGGTSTPANTGTTFSAAPVTPPQNTPSYTPPSTDSTLTTSPTQYNSAPTSAPITPTSSHISAYSLVFGVPVFTGLYGGSIDMIDELSDGSYVLTERSYTFTYSTMSKFFQARGLAKYSSSHVVLRITNDRSKYYIQVPIRSNGNWNLFDTTTPGYILSSFLQKGTNVLKLSYYDLKAKKYTPSGTPKLTINLQ